MRDSNGKKREHCKLYLVGEKIRCAVGAFTRDSAESGPASLPFFRNSFLQKLPQKSEKRKGEIYPSQSIGASVKRVSEIYKNFLAQVSGGTWTTKGWHTWTEGFFDACVFDFHFG